MNSVCGLALSALTLLPAVGIAAPDPIRGDFRVDARPDDGDALGPSVSADSAGNFIVVWLADGHMFARQFDPSGAPVTEQIPVDPVEAGVTVEYPRVVMRPKGDWAYFIYGRESGDGEHVMIRRYRPRLHRIIGRPVQMDTGIGEAMNPNLAIDPRGKRLGVVWATTDAPKVVYFRTLTRSGKGDRKSTRLNSSH